MVYNQCGMTGLVSDIQRFSIHDGPGIRTTVFLKGCNLRCAWCHNPETIGPAAGLQIFPEKCVGCGACLKACPRGAHAGDNGQKVFRRDLCAACGACARTCYAEALVLVGRTMTPRGVADEVLRDRAFYANSGGGATLSGGEPLFQAQFAREILRLCRAEGIHTAIETNLAWPWQRVESVLADVDLVMLDIKTLDSELHRRWTGLPNQQVLDNAQRLSRREKPLIVRTPVIPGVNDTAEAIGAIADFIAGFANLLYYELLAYHPLGTGKYASLGMEFELPDLKRPAPATMHTLAQAARQRGLTVRAGNEE